MTTTASTNYEHYSKLLPYLSEYRQKYLMKSVNTDTSITYTGIEVHANAFTLGYHVQHIKDLLAGMGYSVEGNANTETIIIK